jgi:hypothetical protein
MHERFGHRSGDRFDLFRTQFRRRIEEARDAAHGPNLPV